MCQFSAFKKDVSLQVNLPWQWCVGGHYLLISKNYLADWLAAFPFSQALGETVRAELLGYKRFSPLELAAAHSGRAAAYLATDCKRKGKIITFSFRFFSSPVGDIDCIWVTLIATALLRLPCSLKAKNWDIQFLKMHIFPLAGLGASGCQVSHCVRPYTAAHSTSRLHESGFSV